MGEKCYFISEASKLVGVETHVLRYWEEQLGLEIRRNEMGHRYYIEEDIRLLQSIRQFMEKGIQLRAVKMMLPGLQQHREEILFELIGEGDNIEMQAEGNVLSGEVMVGREEMSRNGDEREVRMAQFQEIMSDLIGQALKKNNPELAAATSETVSERVLKEMDYLMRIRENQEEERYKKLDESIRSLQKKRVRMAEEKKKKKESKRNFRKAKA